LADTSNSTVWCFIGDGETDEPETLAQLTLASRERLNNLVFIVNCNLQRLDGPVRGNGKILQELEGRFRGAGWDVVKAVWGSEWDDLFSADVDGILSSRLEELLDGDEQRIAAGNGAYMREELFNTPELKEMVSHISDEELEEFSLGGHDFNKLYAAFNAAKKNDVGPTVILARTLKGYGLGKEFQAKNITHQKKKADIETLKYFRDRLEIPFTDEELEDMPFFNPGPDSPEIIYMQKRRKELDGYIPSRIPGVITLETPPEEIFSEFDEGTKGEMEVSTTMAFVRLLRTLMRSSEIGKRIVPIVPDEARTFGMDPLFSEFGIYAPHGQNYTPVDHSMLMKYKEEKDGQILEEGITEAGAISSFIASGMSYCTQLSPTLPFYIFYSMFGFQRVHDLIWSAADSRVRGFLMGATAGRTTLNGEGLQHQDGHSLLMASTVPSVRAWDPAFAYELSVIIKHGVNQMWSKNKDEIFYIMLYNQNYPQPPKPQGVEENICKGMYLLRSSQKAFENRVRILGSGSIMMEVIRAVDILETEYKVGVDIWSVTSYGELRKEALDCEKHNRLNPHESQKEPWVSRMLSDEILTTIAVSDYIRAVPEMIARWMKSEYYVLGTDGFGRSDTRENLRRFFQIDAEHIVLTTLSSLIRQGKLDQTEYVKAKKELNVESHIKDITE
jgi:pyruvate dehydrogenase E1 component